MFKKIVVAMLLIASSLMAAEVHWAKDYKAGLAVAQKEHKPVLFIISSDECKYCLLLDRTTLRDAKVVDELNKNFVTIRSWTTRGDYIPMEIAQNTPGLPGIWFLYPDGTPMYQPVLGYMQAPNFFGALKTVEGTFKKHEAAVKKGK